MEIAALLQSWIDIFRCYLRSRLPVTVYFPLALFLATAGAMANPSIEGAKILFGAVAAYLLVLQFRLWDDLESIENDRARHPDRVLGRAPSLQPFIALLALCFMANAALLYHSSSASFRQPTFFLLCSVLLLWYRRRKIAGASSIAGFHLLLIKYPVIVLLLSDPAEVSPVALLLSMAVVYLCFCVYEALHDTRYWTAPAARWALAVEMTGLVALSLFLTGAFAARDIAFAFSHGFLTVGAAGCFIWLYRCHRFLEPSSRWNYLVFIIGFLQLVGFSFGGKT